MHLNQRMKIFFVIPDTVLGIRPAGEAYVERMRCGGLRGSAA